MTTENTARKEWAQRFGTVKSLQVKNGRKGRYGIITIDCGGRFEQTAFIFKKEALDAAIAAGEGANIWMKGPIEPVQRTNAAGKSYTEDQMKVVYFKDNTEAPEAAADDAPEAAGEGARDEASATEAEAERAKSLDEEIPY